MTAISETTIKKVIALVKGGEANKAKQVLLNLAPVAELLKEIPKIEGIDRVNHFAKKGYRIEERPMGSGGVGQVKLVKQKREVRVQLTYGRGMGNYAWAIIFDY